jgi:hypothetical protein
MTAPSEGALFHANFMPRKLQFLENFTQQTFVFFLLPPLSSLELVFLNFYGAQESIPPIYVAWLAGTTTLFLPGF